MNKQLNYGGRIISIFLLIISVSFSFATTYSVSTKSTLQSRMNAAMPGDTIILLNGTYNNWNTISFSNNNGSSTSDWIVLKAETFRGVTFTGNANIQFKGTHVRIDGFVFYNGNAGTNAVISFRNSSSNLANYCRISNIVIDNFNTPSSDSSTENEWVGIFGTNNRVDHCTFVNKYNARATVVVWYSSTTYPAQAISTYHQIDSNYFAGRSYQGDNGGETIRVGDSNASRTNGYNTIEYNLFENCTQVEPEIISNKSNFNTYRYNTFKNCMGGLTLRHGRYCSVYSNFFIVDNAVQAARAYGIRIIDKGHKVFNNYLEGLGGNKNSLTSLRCPIILYNGITSGNDSTDASKASGYFPADSCLVAFNTIANCSGGGGIVLGFTDGGNNTYQPKGMTVANNLIKMTTGQAAYNSTANTVLTYFSEGNIYDAPNGVGLGSSNGFTNQSFGLGLRNKGMLTAPPLVSDAAVNTASYSSLLNDVDAQSLGRTAIYDVGCSEWNAPGVILTYPLDSTMVGAGKPEILLPVQLINFKALLVNKSANLTWEATNESGFKSYTVESGNDGIHYNALTILQAATPNGSSFAYHYRQENLAEGKHFYRLKMIDKDGSFTYSPIRVLEVGKNISVSMYPNPARNFMTVDLNGTLQTSMAITLFDVSGRKIMILKPTTNSIDIPLQNLSAGLYNLLLTESDKVISNHPFIIAAK